MGARKWAFIAVLLSCIGVSFELLVASCPGGAQTDDVSLERSFNRSTAVFIGRAITRGLVKLPKIEGTFTDTIFEVEDIWKGPQDARTLVVRTCGYRDPRTGQEQICGGGGYLFEAGSRYVLFVSGEPLRVDCDPVALIDSTLATPVLAWLSSQSRQTR
jgi:hypothetical protein